MVQSDANHKLSNFEYLLAGSISGFISRTCVQPLDVLKIRFQLQVEPIQHGLHAGKYRGITQAISRIFEEEGSKAFWKGHVPAQLQAVSFTATQFFVFETLTSWWARGYYYVYGENVLDLNHHGKSKSVESFFCGCVAGSVAAVITQPLDVLRTRFIAQGEPKMYINISDAAYSIARREGLQGFFRGLSPSILLIAPQTGLQFAIYNGTNRIIDNLIDKWKERYGGNVEQIELEKPIGAVQSLIAGSAAGIGAKCFVYPLDMAKKRMQVQGFEEARANFGQFHTTSGLRHCLVSIYRQEGPVALFKGLRASLLKSCISLGCRFTVYEQLCHLFRRQHDQAKL